jgi:hypothetical protein
MRPILYLSATLLIATTLIFSCKKHNTPPPATADLLQHKWELVSVNGEALRYVGMPQDYFDFEAGRLIEYFGGQYDTLSYNFSNNTTLELRSVTNNVANGTPFYLDILALTSNQLVLAGNLLPVVHILDSLRR